MACLPASFSSRSRWLVAAMLAFHDDSQGTDRPTTWAPRLTDRPFTVRADGPSLEV
jgi:hypothetical protein